MASRTTLRPLLRATKLPLQPRPIFRFVSNSWPRSKPAEDEATKPAPPAPAQAPKPIQRPAPRLVPKPLPKQPLKPEALAIPAQAQDSELPAPPKDSHDWSTSYHGLGMQRFSETVSAILMAPLTPDDIEVKPDGILYLPEIKYRRILNQAFGPGGWGLVPKGEVVVGDKVVTREYALIAEGRFVSQAQGENNYFGLESLPSAVEGCKSNALMRCCKDLGIASELWDPGFIRSYKKKVAEEIWVEHAPTKKVRKIWRRKDVDVAYPYVIQKSGPGFSKGG